MKPTASNKRVFFRPERCLLCLSCVLACRQVQQPPAVISDPAATGPGRPDRKPAEKMKVTFARGTPWVWKCQQCRHAPCAEACFTGGLHLDPDSRTVVQDEHACVGCGSCLLACPIDGMRLPPEQERPEKCDACRDLATPACVAACQSRALVFVDGERFTAGKRKRFAEKLTGKQ